MTALCRQYTKLQCSERFAFVKDVPENFHKEVDVILDNFDAALPIDSCVLLAACDGVFTQASRISYVHLHPHPPKESWLRMRNKFFAESADKHH